MFKKVKDFFDTDKTKTVYRYVTQEELNAFNENEVEGLGHTFYNLKEKANNHHYNEQEQYLHFFDNLNNCEDVKNALDSSKENLCSFEIPIKTLNKFKGKGFYSPHGYDNECTYIKEYALPVSEYNNEWFNGVVGINQNNAYNFEQEQ